MADTSTGSAPTPQRVSAVLAKAGHQRSRRLSAWENASGFRVRKSLMLDGAVTVEHVPVRSLDRVAGSGETARTMLARYARTLVKAGYSARLDERGNYLIVTSESGDTER